MNKISKATRGLIAGMALFVGIVTGGIWLDGSATTQPQAAPAGYVFAGRAGILTATPPDQNGSDSQEARKIVGTTGTGCFVGLVSGGLAGAGFGCLGGLFSNIPW